jgi:hypothetical protein
MWWVADVLLRRVAVAVIACFLVAFGPSSAWAAPEPAGCSGVTEFTGYHCLGYWPGGAMDAPPDPPDANPWAYGYQVLTSGAAFEGFYGGANNIGGCDGGQAGCDVPAGDLYAVWQTGMTAVPLTVPPAGLQAWGAPAASVSALDTFDASTGELPAIFLMVIGAGAAVGGAWFALRKAWALFRSTVGAR